jgi:hypothetical protein
MLEAGIEEDANRRGTPECLGKLTGSVYRSWKEACEVGRKHRGGGGGV